MVAGFLARYETFTSGVPDGTPLDRTAKPSLDKDFQIWDVTLARHLS